MLTHTQRFTIWKFYRTVVLPFFILVAMLSMLFSGVLSLIPTIEEIPATGHVAADAEVGPDAAAKAREPEPQSAAATVTASVAVAAALMMLHAAYLSLMAYHLVYRFPIERVQKIAFVYAPIVFAYVAHATHGRGLAPWSSGLAFAFTYLALAVHGYRHGHERALSERRALWMWRTDVGLFFVALILVARELDYLPDWIMFLRESAGPTLGSSPVFEAVLHQTTPKDVFVAFALAFSFGAQLLLYRKLHNERNSRRHRIAGIQTFEAKAQDLATILSKLPRDAAWLDLWSGSGRQLAELARVMFESDMARLARAAKDHAAEHAASGEAYVPPPCQFPRRVVLVDEDETVGAAPRPDDWPQGLAWDTRSEADVSKDWRTLLADVNVVHLSHFAYDTDRVSKAVGVLRHAPKGTLLLLRFTSHTSFYRAISASASCSPFRPYVHHHMHTLLIQDLASHGWARRGVPDPLLVRYCRIDEEARMATAEWVEAQYGEFSADVANRYLESLASDQKASTPGQPPRAPNYDRLVLLEKSS